MPATLLLALLFLAVGTISAACFLAKRMSAIVSFVFIAAYILTVGAVLLINIGVFHILDPKFRQMWVEPWLEIYWPLWTAFFAPSAIFALLACWYSHPSTRRAATAL